MPAKAHSLYAKIKSFTFLWSIRRYKFEGNFLGLRRAQAISRKVSVTAKNGGVGEFEVQRWQKAALDTWQIFFFHSIPPPEFLVMHNPASCSWGCPNCLEKEIARLFFTDQQMFGSRARNSILDSSVSQITEFACRKNKEKRISDTAAASDWEGNVMMAIEKFYEIEGSYQVYSLIQFSYLSSFLWRHE